MTSAAACAASSAAPSSLDAIIALIDAVPPTGPFKEPRSMGNRLSKLYTRTGDDGTTGLGDGSRVPKDGPRVEAYGTVDELNSTIGVLLAAPAVPPLPDPVISCLTEIQHELFDMGGELCIPGHRVITDAH